MLGGVAKKGDGMSETESGLRDDGNGGAEINI